MKPMKRMHGWGRGWVIVLGMVAVLWGVAPALAQRGERSASSQVTEEEVKAALDKVVAATDHLSVGSESQEALKLADEALEVLVKPGEWPGQGLARLVRGHALYCLDRSAEAVPELEAAARMLNVPELEGLRATALKVLGEAQMQLGHPDAANRALDGALELYRKVGNPLGEANTAVSQGDVLSQQGRLGEALEKYDTALALYREVGDALGEANTAVSQGDVLSVQGRLREALEKYDTALALYREVGDALGEAHTVKSQGDVLYQQGRPGGALEKYDTALALCRKLGDSHGEANTVMSQGDVLFQQGPLGEALEKYDTALALYRKVGDPRGEANAVMRQGDVLYWQGRLEEALEKYDTALPPFRRLGDPEGQANVHVSLARALALQALELDQQSLARRDQGRTRAADAAWDQTLETRERAWVEAQAYFSTFGHALLTYGDAQAQRSTVEQHSHLGAELILIGSDLVQAELDRGSPQEALRYAAQIYDASQILRSRSLLWYRAMAARLVRTAAGTTSLPDEALLAWGEARLRLGRVLAAVAAQEARGTDADSPPSDTLPVALQKELFEARLAFSDAQRRLQQALALPPSALEPPTAAEVLETLEAAPGAPVLVEYVFSEQGVLALVLDPRAKLPIRIFVLARASALEALGELQQGESLDGGAAAAAHWGEAHRAVTEIEDALGRLEDSVFGADNGDPTKAMAALDKFAVLEAHTLHERLLLPLNDALGCSSAAMGAVCDRPLWIVPDGSLHRVPFAALPLEVPLPPAEVPPEQQSRWMILNAPYLGMQRPLVMIPSSVLLVSRLRVPRLDGNGVLVMGDPANAGFCGRDRGEQKAAFDFAAGRYQGGTSSPDARSLSGEGATEGALEASEPLLSHFLISTHGIAHQGGKGDAGSAGYVLLNEAEVAHLRMSGSGSITWVPPCAESCFEEEGEDASPDRCTSMPVSVKSGGKAIRLVSPGGTDPTRDGVLFGEELLLHTWSLESAVFSVCLGARGPAFDTEGFTGITHALLANGVETVVSSLWSVRLEPAPVFMAGLYRAHFEGEQRWDQALLEARRAMREGTVDLCHQQSCRRTARAFPTEYPLGHPYFWGGFTLYGAGLEREVLPFGTGVGGR